MLLQLSVSLKWRNQSSAAIICSLGKKGHRLLSSIDSAGGDSTISHRLIRKFVASTSKSVALNTLSHLLSSDIRHYSSLALPMYGWITEASWFEWNPKLVSTVIASLENQGQFDKLASQERELAVFYCNLINSYSKYGSKKGIFDSYNRLKRLLSRSSSLNRQAYESMINGLCTLDLPNDAEDMMEKMRLEGFKPSDFEFRSVVLAYGRLGSLNEMRRVLDKMENSGYTLDTISSNIVLSSYGANRELSEMVLWIKKMKRSNVSFSVRTYNSVLNSLEGVLVQELIDGSSVLLENLKWDSLEGKLDLHGMHMGTAYVVMLEWMDELKSRFRGGDSVVIPVEIRIVCGLGNHKMMVRLKSPMRIGRKNVVGSFVGKGKAVRDWLRPVVSNETEASVATRALIFKPLQIKI
ncbi:hypothetical protein MKX01_006258 [Papaver californicum]|nr:hypothetical protein MKX01_006258 [Papaver californicum]